MTKIKNEISELKHILENLIEGLYDDMLILSEDKSKLTGVGRLSGLIIEESLTDLTKPTRKQLINLKKIKYIPFNEDVHVSKWQLSYKSIRYSFELFYIKQTDYFYYPINIKDEFELFMCFKLSE